MAVFDELNNLNINGHTEEKEVGGKKLTYLSWPWAWAEVKKRYPDAHYTIWKNEDNLPYTFDPATGYMVYTSVTIDGVTHEMWLPVMDGANKAMKNEPYEYTTRYNNSKKTCEAATMMDINKTIMRCLVKNLAMFGLGLYIYAGEDLPESEQKEEKPAAKETKSVTKPATTPGTVTKADKLPTVSPVKQFLLTAMAGLRQKRNISADANSKLFTDQCKVLIKAKMAPDKSLEEYTMDEAAALIEAMEKCFDLLGTELKAG